MAKAIKFPLEMNGEQVRDIDSLKEHFDTEKVLEYFLNGKLLTWLEARYYDEEAEAVSQLSSGDPDVAGKLCDIFGVEHEEETAIDVEAVAERNARIARLKEYTDDEEIIRNVDSVAFDQEDLAELYDRGVEKIYLCAGEFRIPKSKQDLEYIQIGGATISGLSETLKEAVRLFLEFKLGDAYEKFQTLAKRGDGRAMYFLGEYYTRYYGIVSKDDKRAKEMFVAGANAGDVLSTLRVNGTAANSSTVEAVKKIAEDGDAVAQFELLKYYEAKDKKEEMFKWCKLSAENGYVLAQNKLGLCYENGSGVEKDLQKAAELYMKAATIGYATAQENLGVCYENGSGVEQDLEKAFEWYKKAAEQGNPLAQINLGLCYEFGKGTEIDKENAVYWYRKAAEQDDAAAQCNLGFCFEKGIGTAPDEAEAAKWYKRSAEHGNLRAMSNLGLFYQNGKGVAEDKKEAFRLYEKSAKGGYMYGQYNLAFCYENGIGVETSKTEALSWYKKAAEQGHEAAKKKVNELENNPSSSSDNDDWIYDGVKTSCEMFLWNVSGSFNITYNLKRGLGIQFEDDDDIYLAHDDTLLGSGKNGFAITKSGLYCRDFGDGYTNYMTYKDFARASNIHLSGCNIYADDQVIAYYSGSDDVKDALLELYESLHTLLFSLRW